VGEKTPRLRLLLSFIGFVALCYLASSWSISVLSTTAQASDLLCLLSVYLSVKFGVNMLVHTYPIVSDRLKIQNCHTTSKALLFLLLVVVHVLPTRSLTWFLLAWLVLFPVKFPSKAMSRQVTITKGNVQKAAAATFVPRLSHPTASGPACIRCVSTVSMRFRSLYRWALRRI
jgi:hypothetical protein